MKRLKVVALFVAVLIAVPALMAAGGTSKAASSAVKKPSGTPVKLFMISDVVAPNVGGGWPETKNGVELAVKAVNAAGGVQGRPLSITICDSHGDANQVTACANQAVADPNVIAVVGGLVSVGSPLKILQAAGVAFFGNFPVALDAYTTPNSFPLYGGVILDLLCAPPAVKDVIHGTTITWAHTDIPALSAITPVLKGASAPFGITLKNDVGLPPTASDLSAQAAAAVSNVDAVVIGATQAQASQFVTALKATGSTKPVIVQGGLNPAQIKDLGKNAENVYGCDAFRPTSKDFAGGKQFTKENSKGTVIQNATGVNAWLAVHVFADIAQKMTKLDRATFLSTLPTLNSVSTYGYTGTQDFTKKFTGAFGAAPQIFSRQVFVSQVRKSKLTLVDNGVIQVAG